MEEAVRQVIDDNRILDAILRFLTSKRAITPQNLDLIMEITVQRMLQSVSAESISIYLLNEEGKIEFKYVFYSKLLYKESKEKEKEFLERAKKLIGNKLSIGEGVVGKAILNKSSSIVNDVTQSKDYQKKYSDKVSFVVKSLLTVPIISNNKAIGAFQVLNKLNKDGSPGEFTQSDLILVEEIARYSARVIEKAQNPDIKISEEEMAGYISKLTGYPFVKLDEVNIDEKLLELIGEDIIKELKVLPLSKTSPGGVRVAMVDPLDIQAKDFFQIKTRLVIEDIIITTEPQINAVLNKVFKKTNISQVAELLGSEFAEKQEIPDVSGEVDENSSPIVQLSTQIIEDAYIRNASDIHIEPFEKELLVRYRIDGYLQEILRLPKSASRALASRLKIMSGLDISERRLPQDGRIMFKNFSKNNIDIDLRVSTAPVAHGEKIVMRILDKKRSLLPLEKMGFSEKNLKTYRETIRKPYGMILHVGPTGSGKTTTLYAALQEINTPDINIQTAEDPIEYTLKGINQMQMNSEIGLTFARALRCFLRQDPDVILVGEIRDKETAEIAIEASLTGHLLFSTLHTNDAAGTVVRFLDMGIEPFLVSSSLLLVCAQRLMRRLCPKCKQGFKPSAEECKLLNVEPNADIIIYRPKGCSYCNNTGYKGRIGIHEILTVNAEIKELINKRAPSEIIKEAAVKNGGMTTLFQDAMEKVKQGHSSIEEALATVLED